MNSTYAIRTLLRQWVLSHRPERPGDVLLDELCFLERKNRADLVHANGILTAFEIKSGADSLVRWPNQMKAYLQVFDEVWLCFHARHIRKAMETSAPSVGLLLVDDLGGLAMIRAAKKNKEVNAFFLSGLLWRAEVDELFLDLGLTVSRREKIKEARARLAQEAPLEAIQAKVLGCLKKRYAENPKS